MTLTSEQLRAARAMLRMDQAELAKRAEVSLETIKRLEKLDGELRAYEGTLAAIQSALERSGVIFLDDKEGTPRGGPGLRLAATDTVERWNDQISLIVNAMEEAVHLEVSFAEIEDPKAISQVGEAIERAKKLALSSMLVQREGGLPLPGYEELRAALADADKLLRLMREAERRPNENRNEWLTRLQREGIHPPKSARTNAPRRISAKDIVKPTSDDDGSV